MTKDELIKLGLDDAVAQKVADASAVELKNYVAKTQHDEVVAAKTELDAQLKERDKQLENLKKTSGDTEALKKQITDLQAANKTAKTEYENRLKDLQVTNAVKVAVAADAQDVDLVAGLIDKTKLIVGDDGKITGLTEQLKTLKESKAFLFKVDGNTTPPYKPKAGNGGGTTLNPFAEKTFNLTEQGKLLKSNPEQARALAAAAGVKI